MQDQALNPWTLSVGSHLLLLVALSVIPCTTCEPADVEQARDPRPPKSIGAPVDAANEPRITLVEPQRAPSRAGEEPALRRQRDSRDPECPEADGLEVHLSANRGQVRLGEPIVFDIAIENTSDQPIALCVGYTWDPRDSYIENYFQNAHVLYLADDPDRQLARLVVPYEPACVTLAAGAILRYQTAATIYGDVDPATNQNPDRQRRPWAHVAYGLPRAPTFVQSGAAADGPEYRFVVRYRPPPRRSTSAANLWDRELVSNIVPITLAQ